jgi:hypothetical protein
MSEGDIENAAAPAPDEGKAGYKRAPVKNRFPRLTGVVVVPPALRTFRSGPPSAG